MSTDVQTWAENSQLQWYFHLLYDPTGAGLIEKMGY